MNHKAGVQSPKKHSQWESRRCHGCIIDFTVTKYKEHAERHLTGSARIRKIKTESKDKHRAVCSSSIQLEQKVSHFSQGTITQTRTGKSSRVLACRHVLMSSCARVLVSGSCPRVFVCSCVRVLVFSFARVLVFKKFIFRLLSPANTWARYILQFLIICNVIIICHFRGLRLDIPRVLWMQVSRFPSIPRLSLQATCYRLPDQSRRVWRVPPHP